MSQINRYLSRISHHLLDRIDIHVEVLTVKYANLSSDTKEEGSEDIRNRVLLAREIQKERYKNINISFNSDLKES